MRVFSGNIFNKYAEKVKVDNLSSECNLDDVFNRTLNSKIKFEDFTDVGNIALSNIDEKINTFAFFKCNARFLEIEITGDNDEKKYYPLHINNDVEIVNIEETKVKAVTISFFKDKEAIECKFLMAGFGVDFPPHSPKKTHSVNYTHEKFFSQSGHYFARHLPVKKNEENGKLVKYLGVWMRKSGRQFYDICKWYPNDDKMGILFLFADGTSKIPRGYLFCDGREMSRAGYKYLFDTRQ